MLSRKLLDILKQQEDVVGIKADFHSSERQQIEIIKRRDKVRRGEWGQGEK